MSSPADVRRVPPGGRAVMATGSTLVRVDRGWQLARTGESTWRPASVPGTVSDALGATPDVDDASWDFRTALPSGPAGAGERICLRVGGIATRSEVHLNGEQIYASSSMFTAARIDITSLLRGGDELLVRCLPLHPALHRPERARARWRTRLADDSNLRHVRTSLIGRAAGVAPGPPAVGPWRPITLAVERALGVDEVVLRPQVDGSTGTLQIVARLRALDGASILAARAEVNGPTGGHACELVVDDQTLTGQLVVPDVALWWPHTHGTPHQYELRLVVTTSRQEHEVRVGAVGFRTLTALGDPDRDGLALEVNGVEVFARGVVWTPRVHGRGARVATALTLTRDAGMNMLRVPGFGVYETEEFHAACDRLGMLVWQDVMLANFDYPWASDDFRAEAEREVGDVLAGIADRPSTAVICGGSEVEQQAAMLGVAYPRESFYDETLPELVRAARSDAVCIPSSPWGGDLPFRTDRGVVHYFGVGAYLRPFSDARLAGVRFASECLALSNVPDQVDSADVGLVGDLLDNPGWSAGVPRDRGASWDFEDVRDHYLEVLYGVSAAVLRRDDPALYLDLARMTSGRVMAEVLGEWRRPRSTCRGALILWCADLQPGAGWGLLDSDYRPKAAWHAVRRALSPVAVWTSDEGLNGVDVHVANDTAAPVSGRVTVTLFRQGELPVASAETAVSVPARGHWSTGVEALLGSFVDASFAYRFGPAQFDLLAVSLDQRSDEAPPAVATRLPTTWPSTRESAEALGLRAQLAVTSTGAALTLTTRKFVHGVHVNPGGPHAEDNWFDLVPGQLRRLMLPGFAGPTLQVRAINLDGVVHVTA